MIIVEDAHFSMWKEFIKKHHRGELINLNTGEMYREKVPFMQSSKFHFTWEFFKYFGHFMDMDFLVYVQHLLGCIPGRYSRYSKVIVHKPDLLHVFITRAMSRWKGKSGSEWF